MARRTASSYRSPSTSAESLISLPLQMKQKHTNQQPEESDSEIELSSNAESVRDYTKNGYHPVYLGELFCNGKYEVIQKLGYGTFSTVWLVRKVTDKTYFAMKVAKSKRIIQITTLDEFSILKALQQHAKDSKWIEFNGSDNTYCLTLLDKFPHFGVHGTHYCSVFEILGPTLLDVIRYYEKRNQMMPLSLVKALVRQMLLAMVYIHEHCGVIHTDIKPENIMLELTAQQKVLIATEQQKQLIDRLTTCDKIPVSQRYLNRKCKQKEQKFQQKLAEIIRKKMEQQLDSQEDDFRWMGTTIQLTDLRIKVVDFGNACWIKKHYTDNIQTLEYRSPEAIIGAPYNEKADIWSLGCLIFEMITNNYLFKPSAGQGYSEDEVKLLPYSQEHLAMITETFGPLQLSFSSKGTKFNKYFDHHGNLKNMKNNLIPQSISQILRTEYGLSSDVAEEIESFLIPIMKLDPRHRLSARQALLLPWLQEK